MICYLSHHGDSNTVPGTHTFPSTADESQPLISAGVPKKQGTPVGLIGVCQGHLYYVWQGKTRLRIAC